jgi:predicted AAA+ superfamily ATPase
LNEAADAMPARSKVLPRALSAAAERAASVTPVVVITGARQTGKSTLVQTAPGLEDIPYFTLDRMDVLEQALRSPDDLVRREPRMVIDEVQRAPDLLTAIKRAVDENRTRRTGQYILTGSANLLLMNQVSESLAGRATYLTLGPLTRGELSGRGSVGRWSVFFDAEPAAWRDLLLEEKAKRADWRDAARIGGYPIPAYELDTFEDRHLWYDGYVRTYLERDLQALSAVDNLVDFRRLMMAVSLRLGNLVNQTELGRDTGLPQPTVHRYLNLLETSHQLVRLPAFSVNRTKRLIKSPKAYWSDTGLALDLAGSDKPTGAHFENMVLAELLAWRETDVVRTEVLYWRTASGQEVDFVVERGRRLLPIEVKATTRPRLGDAQCLLMFLEEYDDMVQGALLLHGGAETFWIRERVLAVPWWRVC